MIFWKGDHLMILYPGQSKNFNCNFKNLLLSLRKMFRRKIQIFAKLQLRFRVKININQNFHLVISLNNENSHNGVFNFDDNNYGIFWDKADNNFYLNSPFYQNVICSRMFNEQCKIHTWQLIMWVTIWVINFVNYY